MLPLRASLFAVFTLAGAAALPRAADACSCWWPGEGFVAPAMNAREVPPNARIWVARGFGGLRLVDVTDLEVEVQGREGALEGVDVGVSVFTPDAPLLPGHRYVAYAGEGEITRFEVGGAPDEVPPPLPVALLEDVTVETPGLFGAFRGETSCGPNDWAYATYRVTHEGLFVVVDRDEAAQLAAAEPSGTVTTLAFEEHFALGRGACTFNWPEAEGGAKARVRFGTFDLAGNFSGWTDAEPLELPGGCSCTSASAAGTAATAWLLVGLGALWIGRPRRAGRDRP